MAKRRRKRSEQPELVRDGALCVNFVNTAKGQRKPLETYADLLGWGQRHDVLSPADVRRLALTAGKRPAEAEAVVGDALDLRACLERIFVNLLGRKTASASDLAALNDHLSTALAARRLVSIGTGYQLVWDDREGDDLDRMLWAVVLSAAEFLSSDDRRRFRQCPGTDCGAFFIDRSPGSPRKWCSNACGQRVRSRRHYHAVVKPMWRDIKSGGAKRRARELEELRRQYAERKRIFDEQ